MLLRICIVLLGCFACLSQNNLCVGVGAVVAEEYDDSSRRQERRPLRHRKLQLAAPGKGIDDQYIVIYNNTVSDVTAKAKTLLRGSSANVNDKNLLRTKTAPVSNSSSSTFEDEAHILLNFDELSFKGTILSKVSSQILEFLVKDDDVAFIEQDQIIKADVPFFVEQQESSSSSKLSWGLDRINQVDLPLDDNLDHAFTGRGVDVYILDSGIRETHQEFQGRAQCSFNVFFENDNDDDDDNACTDLYGHGSHVAATVAGATRGVAKQANIFAVKVLDALGSGTMSGLIAGIHHIVDKKKRSSSSNNPTAVANLSLGVDNSGALNAVVQAAVDAGIVFVVSAGNDKRPACLQSPASSSAVITVGAINKRDRISFYSNYGQCVNIYSPGTDIESAWSTGDTATKILTGTSMAVGYVAGAAALYLEQQPDLTPRQVWQRMEQDAAKDTLVVVGLNALAKSPNRLLNVQGIGANQN